MSESSYDVVIVGAGLAGIKAAADLTESGLKVALLEGRDRLGGRLYTDRESGSALYELGCSWFHQSLDNPLLDIALKEKLPIQPVYDDNGPAIYDNNGPLDGAKKLGQAAGDFGEFAGLYFKRHPEVKDLPLSETLEIFKADHPLLSESQLKEVERIVGIATLPNGTKITDVSTKYSSQPGRGRDVLPVGGYDIIFNHIAKPVKQESIFTNHAVTSVTKTSSGVLTEVENGKTFKSQYVIVTAPIGVLQSKDIKFVPELPKNIGTAIDNLGVARLVKVYLEFDEVFWPTDTDRFVFVGDIGGKYTPCVVSNWYLYNGGSKHPGLFLIFSSDVAEKIEAYPDFIPSLVAPVLESIQTDKSKPFPQPTKITTSKWNSDKFTKGAISRATIGHDPAESIAEFEKGADTIRFAGEHTIVDGYTFAHGAFRSGAREAKYILDKLAISHSL